jgi:hypothetical protein
MHIETPLDVDEVLNEMMMKDQGKEFLFISNHHHAPSQF